MVRDKKKIYAEANDEGTVCTSSYLQLNELLVTRGKLNSYNSIEGRFSFNDIGDYGIIVYLENGKIQNLKIEPNKTLGIDKNGNLAWL